MGVRYRFSENWVNRLSICSAKYMDLRVIKIKHRFCQNVCHDIMIQALPPTYLPAGLQCAYIIICPQGFPRSTEDLTGNVFSKRRNYSPISFQWQGLFQCISVICFLGRRERQGDSNISLNYRISPHFPPLKMSKASLPHPLQNWWGKNAAEILSPEIDAGRKRCHWNVPRGCKSETEFVLNCILFYFFPILLTSKWVSWLWYSVCFKVDYFAYLLKDKIIVIWKIHKVRLFLRKIPTWSWAGFLP